ncbi:DUF1433 domain-containing protein [Bacillus safensis]|uniref:DUF1433 domain-containing protein n=1 Tax=Bacillus safensis TaxID=561879 RepID=UPI003A8353E8
MRNTIKFSIIIVAVIISVTVFIVEYINKSLSDEVVEEKSDQEKAEDFAKKMKPRVEEHLHKRDIHNFIKTITFEKDVIINPMGDIIIDGYVNDEPELKEDFLKSLPKKEREQYLKDIGEKE